MVIFDCDGVLVDSEAITNRVLSRFLTERGAALTPERCHALFRGTSRSAVEHYMAENGTPLALDWSADFYPEMLAALQNEVTAIDGIRPVLDRLAAAGLQTCVASNGMVAKMEVTLGRTGLLSHFAAALYSAYDVGASKPAPDVFLHAARTHKVKAENCIVIEDSPSGFEAAYRAEMRCLAYAPEGVGPCTALWGARPFQRHADLPTLLGI